MENFFREANQSFSSGKLPCSQFRGNQFFPGLLCVVYHLKGNLLTNSTL